MSKRAKPPHVGGDTLRGREPFDASAALVAAADDPELAKSLAIDVAEQMYIRKASLSTAASAVQQQCKVSRGRAYKLVGLAKKRLRIGASHVTRDESKDYLRAVFRTAIEMGLERERAVLVGVGIGLHKVEYVPDPDLRAVIDAARSIGALDDVTGVVPPEAKSKGTQQEVLDALRQHYFGAAATGATTVQDGNAALPADAIDTAGESVPGKDGDE